VTGRRDWHRLSDAELETALGRALRAADDVPARVVEAGKAAYGRAMTDGLRPGPPCPPPAVSHRDLAGAALACAGQVTALLVAWRYGVRPLLDKAGRS
jgi:hypothetical protein